MLIASNGSCGSWVVFSGYVWNILYAEEFKQNDMMMQDNTI
jgi:hypothetical protein